MRRLSWLCLLWAIGCGKKPAEPVATEEARPAPRVEAGDESEMDASYLADLAQVHLNHRNHDRALALLQRALDKESDPRLRARLQMRLGEAYDQLGRKDEATKAYEQASEKVEDPAQRALLLLRLGQSYRRAGDLDRAAAALEKVLQVETQTYVRDSARSEIIQVWLKQGVLESRVAEFEAQLRKNPSDPETLRTLGTAYATALNQPEKAIPYYEQLVRSDPAHFGLSWQLGNLYYQSRQFEQGVAYFKKLAEKMPNRRTEMYERVASGYASLGKKGEALAFASKMAEAASSKTPHLYVQQAHLLGRIGQDDDAVASFQRAIEMAKTDAQRQQFRYDLASFHSSRKRYNEGRELLEQLQSEPISDQLRRQVGALLENVERQIQQSKSAPTPPQAPAAN